MLDYSSKQLVHFPRYILPLLTVNSPKTPRAGLCIPTVVVFLLFDLPSTQFCDPFLEIFPLLASTMARERKTQYT